MGWMKKTLNKAAETLSFAKDLYTGATEGRFGPPAYAIRVSKQGPGIYFKAEVAPNQTDVPRKLEYIVRLKRNGVHMKARSFNSDEDPGLFGVMAREISESNQRYCEGFIPFVAIPAPTPETFQIEVSAMRVGGMGFGHTLWNMDLPPAEREQTSFSGLVQAGAALILQTGAFTNVGLMALNDSMVSRVKSRFMCKSYFA